ncbi:hypothetical protein AK812_SmicGene48377, partial [Symbiodinium microadriaticum]
MQTAMASDPVPKNEPTQTAKRLWLLFRSRENEPTQTAMAAVTTPYPFEAPLREAMRENIVTMYEMQMAAETRRRALLQSLRGTAEIRRAVGHRQPATPPKHPMVEKRASEDVEQTAAE